VYIISILHELSSNIHFYETSLGYVIKQVFGLLSHDFLKV